MPETYDIWLAPQPLTIHEAIKFAVDAHQGQTYGKFEHQTKTPYVFHVLRVMLRLPERSWIAGVCHDLLEDCGVLPERLSDTDAKAIALLTRMEGEKYRDYIDRLVNATGPEGIIAREVKKADLNENLDHLPEHEEGLRRKYYDALGSLGAL